MRHFTEKIRKAREVGRDPRFDFMDQLLSDRALRPFSIYLSYFLSRRGVTANQVTVAMMICCFIGGLCYFPRNIYINIAGIFLLSLQYFLDLVDGEVARLRNECSVFGVFLDNATHQVCSPIFSLCFGMHIYFLDGSNVILLLTLLLYSVLNWGRGLVSAERAALFKAGHKVSVCQPKKGAVNKRWTSKVNILNRLGHIVLGIYPLVLTGVILVISYSVGTTILYVYFTVYASLAMLAVIGTVSRRALALSKTKLEPGVNQSV